MAEILAGAWRPAPPPLDLDAAAVAAVAPLVLQTTAAPLAWWRVRAAGLRATGSLRPLQHVYRDYALQSAGHEQHLREVIPLLRAAGVEPILIKGWSVARLYPEAGLRPYCDLDLCVRHDQLWAAMDVLNAAADRQFPVELHQGIPDLKDRPWSESYCRSRLVDLGGVALRVLCPEDQLRLLCLHQMRHGACAPVWLCDLGVVLESRPRDFDWDYCLHGHKARTAWIVCWLGLACQLLGARLDEPTLAARVADLPSWLAPAVLARWARPMQESQILDPIKSAYRRRLMPSHSLWTTQFLGLAGRLAEAPHRLFRQARRWRRPDRPFDLHDEVGE